MRFQWSTRDTRSAFRRWLTLAGIALMCVTVAGRAGAQTFDSGSDGSDLAFVASGPAGTVIVFDPTQFHGTQVSANIFNFTSITVQAGVTVRLSGDKISRPVIWLAQGNVDIQGAIDLTGGQGHAGTFSPFFRVPSVPGAGGYAGGVGGNPAQPPLSGNGANGGGTTLNFNAGSGGFTSNTFLMPLSGGAGGGGGTAGNAAFGPGGGAGGGAVLIASSAQISLTGAINAWGGRAGTPGPSFIAFGGCGAGGAIRLVANTIGGNGSINTSLDTANCASSAAPGVSRLEGYNISYSGSTAGTAVRSLPFPLLLPTVGAATARVLTINGTPINPNPATFPDLTVNTTSPVDVVIQTQNIPTNATVKLTILNQGGVADTVVTAPPLGNCNSTNVCTTTVQVVFPFGASRGLTKVTWTQ